MTSSSGAPPGDQGSGPGTGSPPPVSGARNADRAADAAPGPACAGEDPQERQDALLEEAVEETFPASDPISPAVIVGSGAEAWNEAKPGRGG